MTNKNLFQFAESNWGTYKGSITNISRSNNGESLVLHSTEIYNFDLICKDLFPHGNPPCSADGICCTNNSIELIEFKSGFKQKLTKSNYDPKLAECPTHHEECVPYYKIFWENQKRKNQELIESIRSKAIESYILLEKHFLLQCAEKDDGAPSKLSLTVVIDDAGIDGNENILSELAGEENVNDNNIYSIKQALNRLINKTDANGAPYFYDQISVLTAEEYLSNLNLD